MTTDFAILVVPRTQTLIASRFYDEAAAAGVEIEGLSTTHILRASAEFVSRIEAESEQTRVAYARGGFISEAALMPEAPGWARLVALDYYQITYDPATNTRGKFRLTGNASVSETTIAVGNLIVRYGPSTSQIVYTNAEPFTPIRNSYVDVPMVASSAGAASNIGNNATLTLVTAYPGLTATNPPLVGTGTWITTRGRNAEALTSLRDRCYARWADLSEGTSSERFARLVRQAFSAASQANPITKLWVDDTNPYGPGSVGLYLATDSGAATAEQVAIVQCFIDSKHATAAQLALVSATFPLGIRWSTGQGKFKANAAGVQSIPIVAQIHKPADTGAAETQASAGLATLAVSYPIGGSVVYREQIRTAIMNATLAQNVVLSAPTTDTQITAGSIVQFTPQTFTLT